MDYQHELFGSLHCIGELGKTLRRPSSVCRKIAGEETK